MKKAGTDKEKESPAILNRLAGRGRPGKATGKTGSVRKKGK